MQRHRERTGARRARGLLFALAVAVAGAVAGLPAPARADASSSAKAEDLIAKANELRRQGRDERALPLIREAYGLARTPRTAGQLGLVELALGYWDEAYEYLSESLTGVRSHPWVDKNRAMLETALQNARAHLAELVVEGTPAGAEVFLNKKSLGTLPMSGPARVNEGRAEMEVRAPGHRSDVRALTLTGKATTRVTVKLEPVVVEPPPRPDPPALASTAAAADDSKSSVTPEPQRPPAHATADDELPAWRRVLPWALVGGAVVAGGLGVWQQSKSSSDSNSFDNIPECGVTAPMRGSDPRCAGLYQSFSNERTRAFIGYGAAAVLGAGAVGAFIWNAVSEPHGASVTLNAGPRDAEISFSGRF